MARGGSHFGGSSSPRGSSGSGGSHFSGSNRSGSSSSNRGSHYHSNTRVSVHVGGGYYHYGPHGPHYGGSMPGYVVFFIIAVFLFFFSIPLFIVSNSVNYELNIIKSDYYYYQDLIEYAESQPGYIIEAKITGKHKNSDTKNWYLEYILIDDGSNFAKQAYTRTTYSIYTEDQIRNYKIGDKISVAVDSLPISVTTDSMVVEYKNFKLSDDSEYQSRIIKKTICITIGLVLVGTSIILIGLGISKGVKYSKEQRGKNSADSTPTNTSQDNPVTKPTYCPYCGCKAEEGRKKCEHCGANLK